MLSDHLSDHPEAQTVKVIRDSKGGTCAFIQCQVRLCNHRFKILSNVTLYPGR